MRLFTIFGLIFNGIFFIFIAAIIFCFAFDILTPSVISDTILSIKQHANSRLILSLVAALIMLINYWFMQSVIGKMQREKNIAFHTQSGEVSIALGAVEDLIRRLALRVPEVKSLRPDVVVSKKGIVVNLRVDLRSETSIAELTERLQELVRSKIQDMLRGIEEPILIKIHVAKIITAEEKKKQDTEPKEPAIPFYGYGR
jgi:uncharacterized alkaline shock family protein YloU